jgi:hypothetical protein
LEASKEDDMVSTIETEVALTPADRCDRCGARAVARATLASGSDLLFCGHHLRIHEEGLRAASVRISRQPLETARRARGARTDAHGQPDEG